MYVNWEELEKDCSVCKRCELSEGRTNLVFGYGNRNAEVMFIGEGPGEQEDLQGKPFVGRSGQLLDKYLEHIGLSREENIFIANMVKCRPPKNRDPKPDEQDTCLFWLREQVRLIRPKIIVCLGRISSQRLIKPDFRVTQEHGKFFDKNGTLMMGTFHPAALLRNPNQKGAALEDFLKLKEKIEEICAETYKQ